jgi:ketosteroid isomerase-like protein
MKLRDKFFFLFLNLIVATNLITAQTEDVISIKNELNKWIKAYNQKDLDNSVAILAEDYIGLYSGHPDQTKKSIKEQNDEVFKNKFLKATLSMEAVEIVTSGDLGYVNIKQKWTFKPSISNTAQVALEKGILIFNKQNDGKWKIIRSSTFAVSAKK